MHVLNKENKEIVIELTKLVIDSEKINKIQNLTSNLSIQNELKRVKNISSKVYDDIKTIINKNI